MRQRPLFTYTPKRAGTRGNFAAKSKTARRFVTLGPPPRVYCRGGRRGGGGPPRGVRGAESATAGAGTEKGRDAPPKTFGIKNRDKY